MPDTSIHDFPGGELWSGEATSLGFKCTAKKDMTDYWKNLVEMEKAVLARIYADLDYKRYFQMKNPVWLHMEIEPD